MFTGIIQAIAPVVKIEEKSSFRSYDLFFPEKMLCNLSTGASVSNNGCCLTVTKIDKNIVSFDLIEETLSLTNLGKVCIFDEINLERSMNMQTEIGGHLMSGHITTVARIVEIERNTNNQKVWISIPDSSLMKYVIHKGFIGVDGISLTISKVESNFFCVCLIPETLLRTTIGKKKVDDIVNIEIDSQTRSIVDTVERISEKYKNYA